MARISEAQFVRFVEQVRGQSIVVGVDVHKRSYHAALLCADGRRTTFVAPADPEGFLRRLIEAGLRIRVLAYEAGPTGFGLARACETAGIAVIVAAPSRIPRPVVAGAKTDRLDCLKLAQYAAKGLLQPIAVPTPREEAERGLLRRRHQLVDAARRVKQRIKGLLLLHGAAEPPGLANWSRSAVTALESLDLEPAVRDTLDSHLRELDFQTGELRRVEAKLAELLRDEGHAETTRCLRTTPGIGLIVAATFRLELFRPERFAHAGQVASYVGLAPTVRQSGERQGRGRIMPVGQRRLRSLLVEAAWIWIQREPGAKALYGRLLGRLGIAQKAIAAMARRLVVILWRLSVEQRPYRPLAAQP